MARPLRVLIVEDVEQDAELLLLELRRGGFEPRFARVETPEAMSDALERHAWDVIFSDYSLPRFNAPAAFVMMRERGLDLPFIIVSGTIGEDVAVEAMKAGVHDYILKGKLARLLPAVERELREATVRADRKRMHDQLLISDRMVSVGTLAAGVAHEINNPLTAALANLEFVIQDVAELAKDVRAQPAGGGDSGFLERLSTRLAKMNEPLRDAYESAHRMRQIVYDLKMFSRSGDEERSGPIDVRRVLESSLRIAWTEVRHRARLVTEYGEVRPVNGSESRLGQVFLNLIVNAAQAIPEGRADQNEIQVVTREDGERVVVEVRDTGSGMPPGLLAHIFDPFFTTKPAGAGTGLGLAICHRIVEALGGEIAVESEPGKGSVFRVMLPVAGLVDAREQVPPSVHDIADRKGGRILVVDDEVMLGTVIRRMLAPAHQVVALTAARAALEQVSSGERFDVILCDLMMPEMTGMDLQAELLRIAPDQARRMVFMTGGAFTAGARAFLDRVPNARIEKPFDAQGLHQVVATLLR